MPESLSFIVSKCLEKKPENRFASMQAVSRALSSITADNQLKNQASSGKTIKTAAIASGAGTAAAKAMQEKNADKTGHSEEENSAKKILHQEKQIKNFKNPKKKIVPIKASGASGNKKSNQKKRKKRTNFLFLAIIVVLVLAATLFVAQKIAPPSELTVPDFRGMTVESAENEAARYELTITEVGSEYSDTYNEGEICSQSPAEGSNISKGDVVSVVVSKGPQQSTVPDVRGQTLDAATKTLKDADLSVGSVTESYSSSVKAGQVISQGIDPDSKVERNTAVNLEISLGEKPYAVVPDVRGKSLDTASSMLSDAKLNVGNITYQDSDEDEGTVISQGYNPNDHVDEYTAVDLVVSSGKSSQSSETKTAEVSVTADRSGVMQILLTDDENEGTVVFMESVESGDQILRRFDYHGSATFTVMIDRNVIKTIKAD